MVIARSWWTRGRPFTLAELVADGVVHGVGIAVTLVLGALLLLWAGPTASPAEMAALVTYLTTLLSVLAISRAFNLCPITSRWKRPLARLDQAAIFLLIAGTYSPFLVFLGPAPLYIGLGIVIWAAALIGVVLKLTIPHRFGRGALVLYLAIGWSGVLILPGLAMHLPPMALWLLIGGGLTYSVGVIFHIWEKLNFHNAVWHAFVVVAASLQLFSMLAVMVLSRA
jgi:hemolysin III